MFFVPIIAADGIRRDKIPIRQIATVDGERTAVGQAVKMVNPAMTAMFSVFEHAAFIRDQVATDAATPTFSSPLGDAFTDVFFKEEIQETTADDSANQNQANFERNTRNHEII